MKIGFLSFGIAVGVCAGLGGRAQAEESVPGGRTPVVRAVYVPNGLSVDGRLDESIYGEIAPSSGFIQQEPREGSPETEKTEVWVLFDDRNVYVAARLWDSHPDRMIANEMRRDASADIYQNENFSVSLDTFNDRRSGFYFMTNMLGAIRDAQIINEKQANGDWNPIWNPKAARFGDGWTVELEIPFKSLRYPSADEQTWGIQFRRVVRWKNETTFLTRVPASASSNGIYRMADAAPLVGIRTPSAGKNLEVKPYATSRLTADRLARPSASADIDHDFGVDARYGVTKGLTADFTYNTDFAQVEDDQQQVNLTRFGLFFPEKRDFFLEGQGIFSFGGQSTSGTGDVPTLFFSRQIGLAGGAAVPIAAGGRLTGKAGTFSVGVLDIQTSAAPGAAAATNFGVVRVKRDILGKSSVGMLVTERAPDTGHRNSVYGLDANLGFGVTTVNTYYAESRTPGRAGGDESYYGALDYNADRYGASVEHLTVGSNFNPEMGFVRRQDFRKHAAALRFSPRPTRLPAFRKLYYEGGFDYITDNDNRLESRHGTLSFGADLENGDQLSASYERDTEFLDAPFVVSGVTIPVGGYAFETAGFAYQLGAQHHARGTFGAYTGSFYDGSRTEARYAGRVDLLHQVTLEPTISMNWVDLPGGRFLTNLVSTRTTYTLSPRSLVGALVQYNSTAHTVSANVRFKWEYVPGSDLFVVYSEGRTTNPLTPNRFAELQNRTFVVKITRLWRY